MRFVVLRLAKFAIVGIRHSSDSHGNLHTTLVF
jgi:hypothetical protein